MDELVERREVDSPFYLFLPSLTRAERAAALAMAAPAPSSAPMDDKSFADLMDSFRRAKAAVKRSSDWIKPIAFLERLRTMQPQDPYVLQQLALATYKSELPDKLTALRDAKSILAPLAPTTSADAETVGLWGAVHKRLWEEGHDPADLDQGISAYERGFFLKNDYYNGINYAFMLDVRASLSAGDDAVADRVLARRVRTRVLDICEEKTKAGNVLGDDPFWVGATKVEALFGLGRKQEAETLKRSVVTEERQRLQAAGGNANEADWKEKTLNEQLVKLDKLLPNAPR